MISLSVGQGNQVTSSQDTYPKELLDTDLSVDEPANTTALFVEQFNQQGTSIQQHMWSKVHDEVQQQINQKFTQQWDQVKQHNGPHEPQPEPILHGQVLTPAEWVQIQQNLTQLCTNIPQSAYLELHQNTLTQQKTIQDIQETVRTMFQMQEPRTLYITFADIQHLFQRVTQHLTWYQQCLQQHLHTVQKASCDALAAYMQTTLDACQEFGINLHDIATRYQQFIQHAESLQSQACQTDPFVRDLQGLMQEFESWFGTLTKTHAKWLPGSLTLSHQLQQQTCSLSDWTGPDCGYKQLQHHKETLNRILQVLEMKKIKFRGQMDMRQTLQQEQKMVQLESTQVQQELSTSSQNNTEPEPTHRRALLEKMGQLRTSMAELRQKESECSDVVELQFLIENIQGWIQRIQKMEMRCQRESQTWALSRGKAFKAIQVIQQATYEKLGKVYEATSKQIQDLAIRLVQLVHQTLQSPTQTFQHQQQQHQYQLKLFEQTLDPLLKQVSLVNASLAVRIQQWFQLLLESSQLYQDLIQFQSAAQHLGNLQSLDDLLQQWRNKLVHS